MHRRGAHQDRFSATTAQTTRDDFILCLLDLCGLALASGEDSVSGIYDSTCDGRPDMQLNYFININKLNAL